MTGVRPTLTGDDLAVCMALVLTGMGADIEDRTSCAFALTGGSAFLSREINAHLDDAREIAREMRRDVSRPLFDIVNIGGGQ